MLNILLSTLLFLAHHAASMPLDITYALVPYQCKAVVPVCYQGTREALEAVIEKDPLSCPAKNQTKLERGACFDFGYTVPRGKDPIFRQTSIYTQHPKMAPADGIERCEDRSRRYNLTGRALVITTSHGVLGDENCTSCKKTGVASPEFTIPYYIFQDAGMEVTLASIKGGQIPIDTEARYMTHWDTRFWNDAASIAHTLDSPAISSLDFTTFDIIYMAGGWGAAWDLGTSDVLANQITAANAAGKLLGSVCHGALGFIRATAAGSDAPLVHGRNMSAVTNRQIEQLGIAKITPLHPETELRKLGANFFASHGVLTDIDQSYVAVDGKLITGQNQNSACEVSQRLLDRLAR